MGHSRCALLTRARLDPGSGAARCLSVPAPPSAKSRRATIDDDDSPSNGQMKMVSVCRVQVTRRQHRWWGTTHRTSLLKEGQSRITKRAARGPARDPRESADLGSRICMDLLGRDRPLAYIQLYCIYSCIYTYIRMTFHRYVYIVNHSCDCSRGRPRRRAVAKAFLCVERNCSKYPSF